MYSHRKIILFLLKTQKEDRKLVLFRKNLLSLHSLFNNEKRNGQVSYGQLPFNPPGRERSKGRRL